MTDSPRTRGGDLHDERSDPLLQSSRNWLYHDFTVHETKDAPRTLSALAGGPQPTRSCVQRVHKRHP